MRITFPSGSRFGTRCESDRRESVEKEEGAYNPKLNVATVCTQAVEHVSISGGVCPETECGIQDSVMLNVQLEDRSTL